MYGVEDEIMFWQPANDLLGMNISEDSLPISIHCPYHSDDTPSMRVYPDGKAYCFGCGRMYNSWDVVYRYFGNRKEALKYVKNAYGFIKKNNSEREEEIQLSKKQTKMIIESVEDMLERGEDEYSIMRKLNRMFENAI